MKNLILWLLILGITFVYYPGQKLGFGFKNISTNDMLILVDEERQVITVYDKGGKREISGQEFIRWEKKLSDILTSDGEKLLIRPAPKLNKMPELKF